MFGENRFCMFRVAVMCAWGEGAAGSARRIQHSMRQGSARPHSPDPPLAQRLQRRLGVGALHREAHRVLGGGLRDHDDVDIVVPHHAAVQYRRGGYKRVAGGIRGSQGKRAQMAAASASGRQCRLEVAAALQHVKQSKVAQRSAAQRSTPEDGSGGTRHAHHAGALNVDQRHLYGWQGQGVGSGSRSRKITAQ